MVGLSRQTIATTEEPAPMHRSRSVLSQQQRIRHYAEASDASRFFNQLTAPELFDALEAFLPEHHERLFPPTETLSMFMAQAMKSDRSCQNIVNKAAVSRQRHGLPSCNTKTGAYCKARQRMPLNMVSEMVTYIGQLIAEKVPERWRWNGRRVLLADGTTVTLPEGLLGRNSFKGQQLVNPAIGPGGEFFQGILEPGTGFQAVEFGSGQQALDRGGTIAGTLGAGE